mmetsp:Transcript_19068/g.31248  ORF Transcript_19068/g.31248 Transcript_19068/m.31248 type:complete len:111 (-) Transcript_19068:877-1209(-)
MSHRGTSIALAPVGLVEEALCFVEEASFAVDLEMALYYLAEKINEVVEGEEASFDSAKKAQVLHTCDHRNTADWVVDVDFAEKDDDRKNHDAQSLPVWVVVVDLDHCVLG